MNKFNTPHFIINNLFHVLILLTFLTILFFTFISKTEEDTVNRELNSVINNQVPSMLNKLNDFDEKLNNFIKWKNLSKVVDKLDDKYKGNDLSIKKHNDKLLQTSVILCSILLILIILLIIYYKVIKNYNIGLLEILKENISVFFLVGTIEFLFFLNVALKYSPVKSSDMSNDIIDRIEYNIKNKLI